VFVCVERNRKASITVRPRRHRVEDDALMATAKQHSSPSPSTSASAVPIPQAFREQIDAFQT